MNKSIISDQLSDSLDTACQMAAAQGFSHIDLHNIADHSIETSTDEEVQAIKQTLHKYGLKAGNLATTLFFLCPLHEGDRVSLFNPDFHCFEGTIDDHLTRLDQAIRIAKELDCPTIRLFPFRYPDNRQGIAGTDQDIQDIAAILTKAARKAEQADITLVLENCPYSHLPKGTMTKKAVEAVGSPNLRLLWDPANSYRAEKDHVPPQYLDISLAREYEAIRPLVRHIHLKNYAFDSTQEKPFVHTPLTDGDIDYAALFETVPPALCALEPEVDAHGTIKSMNQLQNLEKLWEK